MRIPNTVMAQLKEYMNINRDLYSDMQIRISSGKKYLKRSENPVETDEAARLQVQNGKIEQWADNIKRAQGWEKATDAHLKVILEYVNRARELGVASQNGTNPPEARANMAIEVNEILEGLVSEANAEYLSTPMFSGTSGTQAFTVTRDATGKITAVTYAGNSTKRKIQISDDPTNNTVEYGLTGGGTDGVFQSTTDSVDIFNTLIQFRDALETYGPPPASSIISDIEDSVDHVTEKVVINSVSQKQLKTLLANTDSATESTMNRLSEVSDLDMASALSDLSNMEAALQASLMMIPRLHGLSLMDYI